MTLSLPLAPYLRRVLELLASDASVEEFGALAAEARQRGASGDVLDEIERAVTTALRVRATLRQHRRRERELSALFDTAGDLARLRDLDAVLQAIVRRARALLGTDTAYLTLVDEEVGDTYVRVTAGAVSESFQRLRLGPGEGLGGLVAQTARPYLAADYRSDERFRRTGVVDAGVVDEGLVAILGVPLVRGSADSGTGQVIGVLFAADRTPRAFSADEVALLCSLASHAAVAIDSTRAAEEIRAALAELAEANAAVRAHSAATAHAEQSHKRLTDLVLGGGGLPQLSAAVAELMGGPVAVYDSDLRPVGSTARRKAPAELAAGVDAAAAQGRATAFHDTWVCAALAGKEVLGSVVLHRRDPLTPVEQRLFERSAVIAALLLLRGRSVAGAEAHLRGELLADLLTSSGHDAESLGVRARRLGVDLDRAYQVLTAESVDGAVGRVTAAARQFVFGVRGLSAQHGETTVLLVPDDGRPAGELARDASAQLADTAGGPVSVAASGPARGLADLTTAHQETVRCLRAMRALGLAGRGRSAADLGFVGVLMSGTRDTAAFVRSTLGPVLAYDERRGTELLRTLNAYFSCGESLSRTRAVLDVHVNTVVQRLERIESLLGPDWSTPGRALDLRLALQLRALAGSGA